MLLYSEVREALNINRIMNWTPQHIHLSIVLRYSQKRTIKPYARVMIAHRSSLLFGHTHWSPLKNIRPLLINKEEWALHGGIQHSRGWGRAVSSQDFLGYLLRPFSKGNGVWREWYYKENYKTIMLNLKQYGVWAGDTVTLHSIKVEL